MEQIIEKNIEAISALLNAHKVSKASLFGSAAQNNLNQNSDIDILVWPVRPNKNAPIAIRSIQLLRG